MINDKDINISEKPIAEEKAQASQEPPKQETQQQEPQQHFARNIFRCTQFESHSSKFSHCLSQRTVVNDIRNGDTWRMI